MIISCVSFVVWLLCYSYCISKRNYGASLVCVAMAALNIPGMLL